MLHISINGQACSVAEGSSLLQALRDNGCQPPHPCHDDRLKPIGACRLCLVEVEGQARPVPSCATAVTEGMVVHTATARLRSLLHTNLSLLADNYPATAVNEQAEHPFHQLLVQHEINAGNNLHAPIFKDDSHPYLGIDMDRCIHCQRCVRICDEVQGQFVWKVWGKGEQTHIAPADGKSLLSSGCVSCGACADTCPTGAIFDKRSTGPVDQWTKTTCVYCGVGCQMEVASHDNKVVAIKPTDSPVNHGHLCVKGRYAYDFTHAPDRVTHPMLRRGSDWHAVSWEEALSFTASRLQELRNKYGADSLGVLGSARATNEENYLAQKFARVVLGTNNIDCCARVCHQPSAKALKTMLGTGAATNSFDDIEHASLFMLCGCNPTENHPIVGARIKQAVRAGAGLIVIDPRRTELATCADIHLALRPGTNVLLFNAIAATLLEEGLQDDDYIAMRVDGLADFRSFIAAYAPEQVACQCGVKAGDIRRAARMYALAKPAMCFHGLGMTEHLQGTQGVMSLINLALLTGNLGKRGSGINPLRGQNNVQGSAQMGCEPASLTGAQNLADAKVRASFEQAWGTSLPTSAGLDLPAMLAAAGAGKFKAMWVMGYDIAMSMPNANQTLAALAQLELVIVQDLFLNETAKAVGHVFFPAASVFEKDGSFMNADRRVQRVRQVVNSPGEAKPDWQIITELARHMGHEQGFIFDDPQAIWDEIRSVWPASTGLSYQRLQNESLQWPCPATPDDNHPGTAVLHQQGFGVGPKASLAYIPYQPTAEVCDDDYPLLLTTGRELYHFNAGTMTYRSPNAVLKPTDTLDISPADARQLGLAQGQPAQISSRYGTAVLPVHITDKMQVGQLFCSFHRADLNVNALTSPYCDNLVHAPEYKVTAVRVMGLGDKY
jgi:formate dehydrogenase major subunit